ncbi:hypothetical protein [Filimonas effusa]|uniref:Uncharacterized protein n=1 Tax=Filimonas effusa TaxID=2508721 RepID=A0A4Q1D220_9BACT|nr:hypothetical protein [Filimonas effusa]RXK81916.1 hypothetical protein ESB13_19230 [Filimonas effusa]
MKNITLSLMLVGTALITLISCGNNPNQRVINDSASTSRTDLRNDSMSVCFQRFSGKTEQDTFTVHLVMRDGKVDGELVEMIYEKDTRRGTLKGTVQDSTVTTVWSYIQEGKQDTLPVVFKMSADGNLLQQNYSVDPVSGRMYLSDTASFSLVFKPFDCRKIPKQKSDK